MVAKKSKKKTTKKQAPEPDYDNDVTYAIPDNEPDVADDSDSQEASPQKTPTRKTMPKVNVKLAEPPEVQQELWDRVMAVVVRSAENKIEIERCKRLKDKVGQNRYEKKQETLDSAVSAAVSRYVLSTISSADMEGWTEDDCVALQNINAAQEDLFNETYDRLVDSLPEPK